MNRRFICTVGTSIAKGGYDALNTLPVTSELSRDATTALLEMKQRVDAELGKPDRQKNLSAELKSLYSANPPIDATDQVLLLYSDTLLGMLCAEVVEYALRQYCKLAQNDIKRERVVGLRTDNFEQFRRDGIRNLFRLAIDYFESAGLTVDNPAHRETAQIILNPTGGYKATVPYLTLMGSLYGMKVIYISEESDELIELPPLPLSYDLRVMRQARPLLKRLAAKDGKECLSRGELTKDERDLYEDFLQDEDVADALIENADGMLTLTTLGYLFYQRFDYDYPANLPQTNLKPEEKEFKPQPGHHDNPIFRKVFDKMRKSPYVVRFFNGAKGSPSNRIIEECLEDGTIAFNLGKNRLGGRMYIISTGRNKAETRKIAGILVKEGYLDE